ncbi:MAG: class I SAM-dependent methyltransferase [Thermoguttaceae bacterium]|jgi:SAM-dependent methyltransferase
MASHMQKQETSQLRDKIAAVAFYEERYAQGYMDEWPPQKKDRIFQIIRNLDLPHAGDALDFGCGNGIFTNVLRYALPAGWKVYGTDISQIAIENAKKRYPECLFFAVDDKQFIGRHFDFLFTHHVLEHVYDLPKVFKEMTDRLKDKSAMLHILPCGNGGSFEHNVCLLRKDGINTQLENRFFFEDEGHLRRLTTGQLNKLCKDEGFVLADQYYGNQYYGAIDWITQSELSFIREFTDTSSAVDRKAGTTLTRMQYKLLLLWLFRRPVVLFERKLRRNNKTVRDFVLLILGFAPYVFGKPVDYYLRKNAEAEWAKHKTKRNGSEMYLFFKR